MLNIILFGPPGAGKGTQSAKMIEKYNLVHISTGALFRKHMSAGDDLGKLAQQYIDDGNLVPDAVVVQMVEREITEHKDTKGFIFDGFPRTVGQAVALDAMLQGQEMPVKIMLALEVSDKELIKRIHLRGRTSGRADDQDDKKINNRIEVYKNLTIPVAEYYAKQSKYQAVNGEGNIDEIFKNICNAIDQVN